MWTTTRGQNVPRKPPLNPFLHRYIHPNSSNTLIVKLDGLIGPLIGENLSTAAQQRIQTLLSPEASWKRMLTA